MCKKAYGKIAFTERELLLLRTVVSEGMVKASTDLINSKTDSQAKFYQRVFREFEAIKEKLEAPFLADKSQDAEPEEDDTFVLVPGR